VLVCKIKIIQYCIFNPAFSIFNSCMFLDEATITVRGGNGGRGCVSWRREKFEPMGGPDGGDGGDGGDVIIEADANTDTLSYYLARKKFAAGNGLSGSGSNRGGKNGEHLRLHVPPGTLIYRIESGEKQLLTDLRSHGDKLSIVAGGRGGYGNAHFVSSTRQAPDFAEMGEPGEEQKIHLELRLIADVGIIGYPNVGKSTLISTVSAAKPKIANYPFTTLVPNLGVVDVSGRSMVLCDIPGLIEGASEGKGLGHAFLRHIERCGLLLHLLDLSRAMDSNGNIDPSILASDYKAIRSELKAYSPALAEKDEIVAISKSDLTTENLEAVVKTLKKKKVAVAHVISAATGSGIPELLTELLPQVLAKREQQKSEESQPQESEELPILRPDLSRETMGAYRMEREGEILTIHGKRIEQFTAMTDFGAEGGRERFHDVLKKIGLKKEIQRMRNDGVTEVYIGTKRVDSYL
jgi:GTP-binding protein